MDVIRDGGTPQCYMISLNASRLGARRVPPPRRSWKERVDGTGRPPDRPIGFPGLPPSSRSALRDSEMQVRAFRCEQPRASPPDALRRTGHQNRSCLRDSGPSIASRLVAAPCARSPTVGSDVGTDLSDRCCLVYSPSHRLRMAVGPSRHAGRSHEWHAPRTYPQPHRRGSIRNLRRRVMHNPQPSIMSDFAAIDRPLCSGTAFPPLRR